MLHDDLPAAAAALRTAARSSDAPTAYLALLFLGSIDERQGKLDEAASQYSQAMQIYPYGQSACVALSHLFSRRGQASDARDALVRCIGPERTDLVDPLWTYVSKPGDALGARFDELRAESRQ
jgi:tetratricopeptide (TPR) repeat protein